MSINFVPYVSFDDLKRSESPRPHSTGYLAFPAGLTLTPDQKLKYTLHQERTKVDAEAAEAEAAEEVSARRAEHERRERERAWEARQQAEAARRHAREEREREATLAGEMSWVGAGGMLRDADGRRDPARTEAVRALVREEDAQRLSRARWDAYETAWARLLASDDEIAFADLPWPLLVPPASAADLRAPAIAEFLFDSLRLKGNKVTRRERARSSLLRWHPDKLGGILNRVRKEDLSLVKDGIDAVVMSLMSLQDAVKVDQE